MRAARAAVPAAVVVAVAVAVSAAVAAAAAAVAGAVAVAAGVGGALCESVVLVACRANHQRNHRLSPGARRDLPTRRRSTLAAACSRVDLARVAFPARLRHCLREWRRVTTNRDVLRLVARGLEIEFSAPPALRRRSIEFWGSAEQRDHLAAHLERLLAEGIIEPSSSDADFVSLFFPVPRPGPKRWRWCLDLREVNRFVVYRRFRMSSVASTRFFLRRGDFLTSIDLEDAYHHVPMTRRSARFLAFRALGKVWRFRALVFGLASAPRIFSLLMRPVLRHLHRLGVRVMAYLDDLLIAASSREMALRHTQLVLDCLASLGFAVNFRKSELEPRHSLCFLGVVWDTCRWTMRTPTDKLRQLAQDARRVLAENLQNTLTVRRLAGLAGKMVWAAAAHQAFDFRRRSLHRCVDWAVRHSDDWSARVSLSRTALRDCHWAASPAPLECAPAPIRTWATALAPTLTTDASLSGWGAVLTIPARSRSAATAGLRLTAHGFWSAAELRAEPSINVLEARAVARAVDFFQDHLRSCRQLIVESDNTTTVSYLQRFGGRLRHIAAELERSQRAFLRWRTHVTAVYRPGVENAEADSLSRRGATRRHEWTLSDAAYLSILQRWGVPHVDWFASSSNARCSRFAALSNDRQAPLHDAFRSSWAAAGLGLLVPPFPLLPRVVSKLLDEQASVVLVVPRWPTAPWWPVLRQAACDMLDLGPTALRPASPLHHPMKDGVSPSLVAFRIGARPV